MCPIRSKQRSSNTQEFLSEESSAEQSWAVSKIKDVCHFHQKYKAEEKFFIVLKPTEIVFSLQIFYIFCVHVV